MKTIIIILILAIIYVALECISPSTKEEKEARWCRARIRARFRSHH